MVWDLEHHKFLQSLLKQALNFFRPVTPYAVSLDFVAGRQKGCMTPMKYPYFIDVTIMVFYATFLTTSTTRTNH